MKPILRDVFVGTTSIVLAAATIFAIRRAVNAAAPNFFHRHMLDKVIPVGIAAPQTMKSPAGNDVPVT